MRAKSPPVIDISTLNDDKPWDDAEHLDQACREHGFFYLVGHGLPPELLFELEEQSRRFFALPQSEKNAISMARGGRAWRGYFPLGAELTSGRPDLKEGLYFGAEVANEDPRARAGRPFFGPNLFPQGLPRFRSAVLAIIDALTALGHRLARALSLALGLEAEALSQALTSDPLVLFRIFRYPPQAPESQGWGVGEHTDYGLLTILHRGSDGDDGLEIRTREGWRRAPQRPGAFLCNLGDMLERLTGRRWRSTPHRVRYHGSQDRLAFPFFFDPGVDAPLKPLINAQAATGSSQRWDDADPLSFEGCYGDYLLSKVSKVFPELKRATIDDQPSKTMRGK